MEDFSDKTAEDLGRAIYMLRQKGCDARDSIMNSAYGSMEWRARKHLEDWLIKEVSRYMETWLIQPVPLNKYFMGSNDSLIRKIDSLLQSFEKSEKELK